MLRISLIFCIFAPLKKENDMAEIANRIYETSEGQILFISDFSDINDNEKVVSRALSVEEKKGNIVPYHRARSSWVNKYPPYSLSGYHPWYSYPYLA